MLFMVRIKVELPGDMDPARVQELGEAEADRAIEAINAGQMRKIWRIASGASERLWAGNAKICRLIQAVKAAKGPQRKLWMKQKKLCAGLNGL